MEYLSMESKIAYLEEKIKREQDEILKLEEEKKRLKELLAKYTAEESKNFTNSDKL